MEEIPSKGKAGYAGSRLISKGAGGGYGLAFMTPIVSFIGRHNAGKTTLARRVVAHLSEAGYRVGAVKSTHQSGINYDQEGTDTAASVSYTHLRAHET